MNCFAMQKKSTKSIANNLLELIVKTVKVKLVIMIFYPLACGMDHVKSVGILMVNIKIQKILHRSYTKKTMGKITR